MEVIYHPSNLQISKKVDSGSFGSVFLAADPSTSQLYAIKKIPAYATIANKAAGNRSYARMIVREVVILSMLNRSRCDYVVGLNGVYLSEDKRDVYLLMPFIPYNMWHVVHHYVLEEPQIKSFAYQLLCGIQNCHDRKFMHRDLTLKNILVDADSHVSIADFGLARAHETSQDPENMTFKVTTIEYRAPELLLGFQRYDYRVDIWSIGCMIAEMYIRHRLFLPEKRDETYQIRKVIQLLGAPEMDCVQFYGAGTTAPQFVADVVRKLNEDGGLAAPFECIRAELKQAGASDEAVELLRWMLNFDFRQRPTAEQALAHPWFVNDPDLLATNEEGDGDEGGSGAGAGGSSTYGASGGSGLDGCSPQQQNQQQQQMDQDEEPQPQQQQQNQSSNNNNNNDDDDAAALQEKLPAPTRARSPAAAAATAAPPPFGSNSSKINSRNSDRCVGDDGDASGQGAFLSLAGEIFARDDNNKNKNGGGGNSNDGENSQKQEELDADGAAATAVEQKPVQQPPAAAATAAADLQQQQCPIREWLGCSVDAQPAPESNEILGQIQKMKLKQLIEFMEKIANTDIQLVRGEYKLSDDQQPGMVFENSGSPDS